NPLDRHHLLVNLDHPMLVLPSGSKVNKEEFRNMYRALTISAALCLCGSGSSMGKPPCQLWGGQAQSDWARLDRAVVITDMTKCQPDSALTAKLKKGHWRVIPSQR